MVSRRDPDRHRAHWREEADSAFLQASRGRSQNSNTTKPSSQSTETGTDRGAPQSCLKAAWTAQMGAHASSGRRVETEHERPTARSSGKAPAWMDPLHEPAIKLLGPHRMQRHGPGVGSCGMENAGVRRRSQCCNSL
jgi:hypothetical protein